MMDENSLRKEILWLLVRTSLRQFRTSEFEMITVWMKHDLTIKNIFCRIHQEREATEFLQEK
jgi:hypothetical protein